MGVVLLVIMPKAGSVAVVLLVIMPKAGSVAVVLHQSHVDGDAQTLLTQ